MNKDEPLPQSSIVLYQTEDGRTRIDCRFEDESMWLTQALIAELFQTTPQNVTMHLKAIFAEGELDEAATCKEFLQVRTEGGREISRNLRHYRLEATLCTRLGIDSKNAAQASGVISKTLKAGYIRHADADHPRAGYVPHWA